MSTQKTAHKLSVGQTLYREKQQRRRFDEPIQHEVEQVTVTTVGSKYFTIAEDSHDRYLKATLRSEYGHPTYSLHLTAQEITDEWERVALQRDLRRVLEYQRVPLDVLHQVAALIPEQIAAIRRPPPLSL